MFLKILLICVIIYIIVVTRSRIRLPNPTLQATVDVLQAATLKDEHVMEMARKYIDREDAQHPLLSSDDPYAARLARLTSRYLAVNNVPLNFRVYRTSQINAFATADGSIRIFTGLMDLMNDEELMAIVGHEMGHIRNSDTLSAMRKAYLTSAARNALGAAGGVLGSLSSSQWGSLAEKLASSQFSQTQEYAADDFSFGFLQRNGYTPYAMASALEKIHRTSQRNDDQADAVLQLFSTHPDSYSRAARIRAKADALPAALPAS
ncbi:MAG: M48 family metalloprotease [Alistipes sp.]|nr:M48 family metalloprotease [Alistipes sp.]